MSCRQEDVSKLELNSRDGEKKKRRMLWDEFRVRTSATKTQGAAQFLLGTHVLWAFSTEQSRHQEQKPHPEPD